MDYLIKSSFYHDDFNLITREELNTRIEKSESDFKNNNYKKSADLLTKYK